jgi:uncharacterized protein YecE (DUF72 family)
MAGHQGSLFFGTSGWSHAYWLERVYPERLPQRHLLQWYAMQFSATEINRPFFRTPSLEAVAGELSAKERPVNVKA